MKVLIAGIVVAALGLTAGIVARNLSENEAQPGSLLAASVRDCPDGSVLTSYSTGSRVFAVGRTESSEWVEVRDLDSPDRSVWVSAADVDLDADIADLPVTDCLSFDGVVTAAGDVITSTTTTTLVETTTTTTVAPSTTTTTIPATTTTKPPTGTTKPPPTTTTTDAPDTTAPEIKQPFADPLEIWEEDTNSLTCGDKPRESVITAVVTDDVAVAGVTASWTIGGSPKLVPMSKSGDVYTATFGPFPYLTIPDNTIEDVTITIRAIDGSANESKTTRTVTVNSTATCLG